MDKPKQYVLSTIQDIADMITIENKANFLKDFSGSLNMMLLAKAANPYPEIKIKWPNMVWIDDNEHKVTVNFMTNENPQETEEKNT